MKQNINKILTAILACALILAIAVLIYVNLPRSEQKQTPSPTEATILTIMYNGASWNYSLPDIEALPSFTGSGGYIKTKVLPEVSITGPYTYTGVNMTYLLSQIPNLPNEYSIQVIPIDFYNKTYNKSQIQGTVTVYNNNGNITGSQGVTMIIAYKESGELINDTKVGPLRIAYVDDGAFTSSEFWAKTVRTIKVISE
jgi:hypothetical protein